MHLHVAVNAPSLSNEGLPQPSDVFAVCRLAGQAQLNR